MILDTAHARVHLQPGEVGRLELRSGTRLRSLRGTAWLTADGDSRDIVLDRCEEWVLDRDRRVLATALRADGRVVLEVEAAPRGRP